VQVEQAAGPGGGEGDHRTPCFIRYYRRRAVCPRRREELSTGIRTPLSRVADGVPAGREGFRPAWFRAGGAGGDGEDRVRQHGQRDVPVPGAVPPDLVAVQAGLVLRLSEPVFRCPPGARDGLQLGRQHRPGRAAQEIRQLNTAASPAGLIPGGREAARSR
jgi:hypothetical protein